MGPGSHMALKPGDIVLCTVKSIETTSVFVQLDSGEKGSINMSEVAAGRIRNLREFVAPNKKIVCKILEVKPDHLELSLRRVTGKEREEAQEHYKKERIFLSLLKTVTENPEKIKEKIEKTHDFVDFFEQAKTNPSLLTETLSKKDADKLSALLAEKTDKVKKVKKTIMLRTLQSGGLKIIKEILKFPGLNIQYIGSSTFIVEVTGKDFKSANILLEQGLQEIGKKAKEKKVAYEIK